MFNPRMYAKPKKKISEFSFSTWILFFNQQNLICSSRIFLFGISSVPVLQIHVGDILVHDRQKIWTYWTSQTFIIFNSTREMGVGSHLSLGTMILEWRCRMGKRQPCKRYCVYSICVSRNFKSHILYIHKVKISNWGLHYFIHLYNSRILGKTREGKVGGHLSLGTIILSI